MHRRQFLAAVGTPGVLAGCLSGSGTDGATPTQSVGDTPTPASDSSGDADSTGSTPAVGTPSDESPDTGTEQGTGTLARFGIPPNICEEDIRPYSGIYAILEPAFASDWSSHDVDEGYGYEPGKEELIDDQTVIGLTSGERARAYPLTVLTSHEIVNDTFPDPVMVTFCPICRSGMVADRRLDGEPTSFAVSGLLWQPERVRGVASERANRTFGASPTGGEEISVRYNGNLVMYDAATRSYWSQMLARAICGPRTGSELDIRPSTVATWGEWRTEHPDTEVLLPPPHSGTVPPGTLLGRGEESDQ